MAFLRSIFYTLLLIGVLGYFARRIYLNITEPSRVAKSTLTLGQYLSQYPHCGTSRGIQCAHCHSMSIKNWGFTGAEDPRRLFICNQCNTRLYRTENW
ncbi:MULTISPECIES: hypothetical protein [Cupriavidus]